jgi:hypothetical protein
MKQYTINDGVSAKCGIYKGRHEYVVYGRVGRYVYNSFRKANDPRMVSEREWFEKNQPSGLGRRFRVERRFILFGSKYSKWSPIGYNARQLAYPWFVHVSGIDGSVYNISDVC